MKLLGEWLSSQRKLADLSLRQLAELTDVSSTYLSQVERGLHEPSVRVIKSIADALGVGVESVLNQVGLVSEGTETPDSTEAAIRADTILSTTQKEALLAVYRSYVAEQEADG